MTRNPGPISDSAVEIPDFSDTKAYWEIFSEPNQIFLQKRPGQFQMADSRRETFASRKEISRGVCMGDIDNDGDLDLLLVNTAAPARLYRNVAKKKGNWMRLQVLEPELGNRDAYGARITVQAGEKRWTRWISPGGSYLSSHDPIAHFGLGKVDNIDQINVRWPDGSEETFPGGAVNQLRVLHHGDSQSAASAVN